MSEIYRIISFVTFGISAVCLILSVIFWIKFNIPKIIGDLSGRNARKSIEEIHEKNSRQVSEYSNRAVDYNKMSDAKKNKKTGKIYGKTTTGSISKKSSGAITGKIGKSRDTELVSPILQMGDTKFSDLDVSYGTEKLDTATLPEIFVGNSNETSKIDDGTEILAPTKEEYFESNKANEDDVSYAETDVLVENIMDSNYKNAEGTSLLSEEMPSEIVCSVTIVHTDEVI